MSKKQPRAPYRLEIFGLLTFLIETKNPKLISILEYSDPEVMKRKIVNEHINSTDPWVVSIRDVLIKEMLEIYERESGRNFEWTSSGTYTSEVFKGSGILYMTPTEKEVNKRVKTKDWRWVSDEVGERWVETKKKRYHISCFHESDVVFIKIEKLAITKNGEKNDFLTG